MRRIDINELKLIQLNILSVVHSYCLQNNIRYSLAYGTLLGAVRHKGYIPWDDDIDIIMQRPDYDKFISSFNYEDHSPYRVVSYETDRQIHYPMAKVVNDSTINNELGYNKYGIGIDVFPIDKIPMDEKKCYKLFTKQDTLWKMFMLKSMKWSQSRSLVKNSILILSKCLLCLIDYSYLNKSMNRNARRYNNLNDNYYLGCLYGPYGKKEIASKDVFDVYITMTFEGKQFMCLKDYDTYLSNIYGNYMQLPPIEKQVSHHAFDAYWK